MDYDINLYTEMALKLLEGDIQFWCRRYFIPGYEFEDLCQEVRVKVWLALPKYDPTTYSIRTFAKNVIKNHLRNLLKQQTRQKRGNGEYLAELPDNLCADIPTIDELFDFFQEKSLRIEDFF